MSKNVSNEIEFNLFHNCPNVRNGGKENCIGSNCGCAEDGETVCIMGICVCMHQRHLAFHQISCKDPNHASFLRNISHHELGCPTTCLATSETNSCPPSSKKHSNGRCYCNDGSRLVPHFTNDYTLDLPLEVCANDAFTLETNTTNDYLQSNRNKTSNFATVTSFSLNLITSLSIIVPVSILVFFAFALFFISFKFRKQNSNPAIVDAISITNSTRDQHHDGNSTIAQHNLPNESSSSALLLPSNGKVGLPSHMQENPYYSCALCMLDSNSHFCSKIFEKNFILNEKIKKEKRIGNGHFGEVYKGIYSSSTGPQDVAIKIPKKTWFTCCSPCEVEGLKSFFAEAEIALTFNHKNILSCFGITIGSLGEPWMIVEHMQFGDLANILRMNSGVLSLESSNSPVLKMVDLLHISYQIAVGMQYLATQHFTHRDLAARNCLVGDNLLVKISDFGLTRDIYSNEYYLVSGTEKLLPIRWMAPESITYGRFTHETDIWSYGILLWEIFTFGKVPHYLLSNKEVMEAVSLGQHPGPPEGCPNVIKHLMLSCWQPLPSDRNTFSDIIASLLEDDVDNIRGYSRLLYFDECKRRDSKSSKACA